ncbi:MAG: regulatory protein RecX [Candidatus Blackburnbacteria bacterium]|nr:regulatory protein RecX [Candidatus Blackburnbacteria bacterium]
MAKRNDSDEEKVYNKILRFATLRPRSEKEINVWFKRKKIPTKLHERVFNRLKNLGLVDDKAFASWWIEQRLTFRPKGRRAIFFELRQKGVSEDIIEDVLGTIGFPQEVELARDLVAKKLPRFKDFPVEEKKKKLVGLLVRRGFSWETIRKAVDVSGEDVVE